MPLEQDDFVYLLTNAERKALHIGVTNDVEARRRAHNEGTTRGFTKQYRVDRLAYCEAYGEVLDAIAREKQFKGWTHAKKEALIAMTNPLWEDLGVKWTAPQGTRVL